MIVVAADIAEDMSFVFFGPPSEVLSNFLFLGLLEGDVGAFPLRLTIARGTIGLLAPVSPLWPEVERVKTVLLPP